VSPPERPTSRVEALAARLERARQADRVAALTLAISVVGRERAHRVLEPALEILAEAQPIEARPALRERFVDLTDTGMRYDQDCSLRIGIVKVLRGLGVPADVDLAKRGVRTIQLNPPARIDVAQALRGQSLLWLAELAPQRADYYAVELLQDPHLSEFSGEPAVTAIQVLAAGGNVLPIWVLARRPGPHPDVLAQAFASLRKAPPDLQLDALREHLASARERGESGEAIALVAAEAIILNGLSDGYGEVATVLRETSNPNVCLYLAVTAIRNGDEELRQLVREVQKREKDQRKARAFAEALGDRR
jgi:hypothetical protein